MAVETYLRDINRTLESLVSEIRKLDKDVKKMGEYMLIRSFDDLVPPPPGTEITNMNGVVCVGREDFERLIGKENEDGNERD